MFFRRTIFLGAVLTISMFGKDNLLECNKVFEERKSELILELERITDREQSLEALREATTSLLTRKRDELDKQEKEVNNKLAQISEKEERIEAILEENKKLLEEIEQLKLDKISNTYSKMKAKSAAGILSEMQTEDAVKVLLTINPKVLAKIFAKMNPKKASELTEELSRVEDKAEEIK